MFKYNGPGSPPLRKAFVQIPEGGKEVGKTCRVPKAGA